MTDERFERVQATERVIAGAIRDLVRTRTGRVFDVGQYDDGTRVGPYRVWYGVDACGNFDQRVTVSARGFGTRHLTMPESWGTRPMVSIEEWFEECFLVQDIEGFTSPRTEDLIGMGGESHWRESEALTTPSAAELRERYGCEVVVYNVIATHPTERVTTVRPDGSEVVIEPLAVEQGGAE